jgi:hypothetical protein
MIKSAVISTTHLNVFGILMKTITLIKKVSFLSLLLVILAAFVTGCSEDKKTTTPKPASQVQDHTQHSFDHTHGSEVSDLEKHKFEHDFADQCVEREIKNSKNKDVDRERFAKPCLCIATYLMKDLTAKESELFLVEHKNTQSLRIKFESAAYHCLQEKVQPKSPMIFGKQ